jgi:hypothetical protein
MMLIFEDLEIEDPFEQTIKKDKEIVLTDEYVYKVFSINGFLRD